MKFISNKLRIENVFVQNISKKYGTPAYCYSYNQLKENIDNFKKKFKSFSPLVCFAIKSNTNINLIKEIKKFGLGADVVSMGELMIALKAGITPKKIVFSGIGKTTKEIEYAINKKILLINAESISEIKEIERIAKIKKRQVEVGIRLNPNTDAKTLNQISAVHPLPSAWILKYGAIWHRYKEFINNGTDFLTCSSKLAATLSEEKVHDDFEASIPLSI